MAGPVRRTVFVGTEQLAGFAIEQIEETVLGRLEQNLARLSFEIDIGQNDGVRGRVVPVVAWRGLIVPHPAPGIGVDRHDAGDKQVVRAVLGALLLPGPAIACPDVEQVQFGIVGHRIPRGAAALARPDRILGPGPGGESHVFILGLGIGPFRHDPEPPFLLAGLGIVGGYIAAHPAIRAAVADDQQTVHHARRARDGVRPLGIVDRVDRPDDFAAILVQGDQPAVQRADKHLAVGHGHAPVHDVAAQVTPQSARHFGIVFPALFPGRGVKGHDPAPGAGGVEHAVDHDGRGFQPARGIHVRFPGQPERGRVFLVDLGQRGEALLGIVATERRPTLPAFREIEDLDCTRARLVRFGGTGRQDQCRRHADRQQKNLARQHTFFPIEVSRARGKTLERV